MSVYVGSSNSLKDLKGLLRFSTGLPQFAMERFVIKPTGVAAELPPDTSHPNSFQIYSWLVNSRGSANRPLAESCVNTASSQSMQVPWSKFTVQGNLA